jgi:hypothetical protein
LAEIVDTIINTTKGARREAAVAAGLLFRSAFQHKDGYAVLGRRVGGAKSRVSRTYDDDVTVRWEHAVKPILLLRRRLLAFGVVARVI